MNGHSPRWLVNPRITGLFGGLALLAIACVYLLLRSTESWGSVGTIDGYEARLEWNEAELRLRGKLHRWLEQQGFRRTTLPESLAESRGGDWNLSANAPVAYQGSVEGDNLYFITWDAENEGVKYWQANIYFRDVPGRSVQVRLCRSHVFLSCGSSPSPMC
jgi:hypothetical protein